MQVIQAPVMDSYDTATTMLTSAEQVTHDALYATPVPTARDLALGAKQAELAAELLLNARFEHPELDLDAAAGLAREAATLIGRAAVAWQRAPRGDDAVAMIVEARQAIEDTWETLNN